MNMKRINLLTFYRPPEGKQVLIDHLAEAVNKLNRERAELVIMGDYNIDYNDMRVTRRLKVREFEKRFGLRQ